jgi:predicted enzyme related to lactoylglutathione lyase
MNSVSFFEIQVDDLQKAIDFYSSIFGWEFMKQEGLPIEYYQIKTDGINGGMLQRPAQRPGPMHGTNAYCCSMEVKDFDTTAKHILEKGGQVAMEKFAVPGKCWQGYFLDLDGNVFGLFQVDENAA